MNDQAPQQIRDYCRAWSQRAAAQDRAERWQGRPARIRQGSPLASVCDDLETASSAQLSAIVAGFTVCMTQRDGGFAGTGRDYRLVWAWCAELLVGAGSDASPAMAQGTARVFTLAIDAMLARPVPPEVPRVGAHARALATAHASLVAYLAFPLLEQLLRASCHGHFGADGLITVAFDTPGDDRKRHLYTVGGTCSSIGDLAWLYRNHYAPAEVSANLDEVDRHLANIVVGGRTGFRVLRTWRNATMHGSHALPAIGAAVLNLAILVALADRDHDFDQAAVTVRRQADNGGAGARFYPLEDERTGATPA